MPFGVRSTTAAITENPQVLTVWVAYASRVFYTLLGELSTARTMVDVNIATGAAMQELDEFWAGYGQELQPRHEANLRP